MRLDKPQGEVKKGNPGQKKESIDDPSRFFSYFNWYSYLISVGLSPQCMSQISKGKVFFEDLEPNHPWPLMIIYPHQEGLVRQRHCGKNRGRDCPFYHAFPLSPNLSPAVISLNYKDISKLWNLIQPQNASWIIPTSSFSSNSTKGWLHCS